MRIGGAVALVLLVLLLVMGCGCRFGWSYSNSGCARCGRSHHTEKRYGVTTVDRIDGNNLSAWLSRYRSGACKHDWASVSGGSARGFGFMHWDGMSLWNRALRRIHRLDPVVGEAATRELLDRYYRILDMPRGAEQAGELQRLTKELEEQTKQAFPADQEAR